ncbi:MAG: hypothetical protein Q9162_004029 [Coniocarpon cinnabarinum]
MDTQERVFEPRPYQLEMFDQSMKRNVIVAKKFAWFIGPKVALCEQQHDVLRNTLPAFEHLLLSGADGVDKWSDERTWQVVLKGVRVVVSTADVLKDALSNGFVELPRIAILVFDEGNN